MSTQPQTSGYVMNCFEIRFSGHAVRQMFRREISQDDVSEAVNHGQKIIDYPDDKPYPSCLVLGFVNGRPLHIVLAFDQSSQTKIVITAYIPDSHLWTEDFKSRRIKE